MGSFSAIAVSIATAAAFYARSKDLSHLISWSILCSCLVTEACLYLLYFATVERWLISPTRILPHPKTTSFLFGNFGPFISEPWGFPLAKWQKSMPRTTSGFYRVFLGPFDYLIPRNGKSVAAVMNQPYLFEKPPAVRDGLIESLGVGLVSAEGEVHRKKLLIPTFGLDRNRRLVPQMYSKAIVLAERMEESVKKAGGTEILLMHPLTMAAALDIIGVTTIGVDFDSLRKPDQLVLQAYQAVFPSIEKQTLVMKFVGAVLPAIVSPRTLFKLPVPQIKKFHWGMAILRQFTIDQIRLKKEEIENSGQDDVNVRQRDVLSAILASGMRDENELVSHILTILAAGHESTAVTLAWAIFKLAQLPDVQQRLREEVLANPPPPAEDQKSSVLTPPSLEQINSLPYLRCFLMEVLRLYPVFPAMMRQARQSTMVEDLRIPRHMQIMVSPWAINRSTDLWGPDAEEFRVGRWEESYNGGAKSAQAFMTFSSGQRVCIGKDFATLSLKVALYTLITRFEFSEAEKGWHPIVQKGTSLKPMGLKVKVSLIGH